jgi:prevent-host-death family protein
MPSATEVVRNWGETLAKVAAGEEVEVTQHGRKVAVVRKATRWTTGKEAASIMRGIQPDPETANAVAAEIARYRKEVQDHEGAA